MARSVGAGCAPWLVLGALVVAAGRCLGGGGGSVIPEAAVGVPDAASPAPVRWHRYIQAASLNCRAGPAVSARRVESLPQGAFVGVIRTEGGWSLLDRPTPCWTSTEYLGVSPPPARPAPLYGGSGAAGARSGTGRGRSAWSYANCAAARAAGAAPVHADEPGYGRHLDRDGDGVGCE